MTKEEIIHHLNNIATHSTNLAKDLLYLVEDIAIKATHVRGPTLSSNPFALEILQEISDASKRKRVRESLKALQERKMLEIEKRGLVIINGLTAKGHLQSLRYKLKNHSQLLPNNEYCIVVFDVPEHARHVRDLVRSLLKTLGFRQYQRSVWISDKDLVFELQDYILKINADKWATVLRGTFYT